jgi:uncharacterized membrane protein
VATRGTEALLARLSRVNLTSVFLAAAAVVLAGLLLPGAVGGVLLLLVAGWLVALLSLTWPHTPPKLLVVRAVILTGLVTLAVLKLA